MRDLRIPSALPSVGRLVNEPPYAALAKRYPQPLVTDAIREQVERERAAGAPQTADRRVALVEAALAGLTARRLRHVINATGVVLHTNLGRAPLSARAAAAAAEVAQAYATVELDLERGTRGERATVVEPLLRRLTGAEAGIAVNNNAAAVLLALTALAGRREVIVSRGQQVEIGGSFRMPDVMRMSGARMIEVGTTNRTRAADYAAAITPRTAALLRVHPSNYRVTGFTEEASLAELSELARREGLLLIDDLGSGALEPLAGEPLVRESVAMADAVLFSGDKLVGGPQAGIAVGREGVIRRLARHPLARAVRVDKMTLAALEVTLADRLLERPNPVQSMLAATPEQIRRRAAFWLVKLQERGVECSLVSSESLAGGGSLPGEALPTWALALTGSERIARLLRAGEPPVIARVEEGRVLLDPRTVLRGEDEPLVDAVEEAWKATRTAPS